MPGSEKKCKIKVSKNGPYIVTGNVPLSEKIITPKGKGYEYKDGCDFPPAEINALCRCGKSQNHPYCDGSHSKINFNGAETASLANYADRAELLKGPELDLMDDGRCAVARFCHREDGKVWGLVEKSNNPKLREEAIQGAGDCPSGRLTAYDKTGKAIEPEFEPAVEILQDPENKVSGPIFVKGNIPIECAEGNIYETRNRVALCRCGRSRNKPFCDATHVSAGFSDKLGSKKNGATDY